MNQEKKRGLLSQLMAQIDAEIGGMRKAALDAAVAATHEEAKPENDKDTRALEASYLAAGQAERVRTLEVARKVLAQMELKALNASTPICASAVITIEDSDEKQTTFFMAPHCGGVRLELEDSSHTVVQVVTPQSPLGAGLLGRRQGDSFELRGKGGVRELVIVDVW